MIVTRGLGSELLVTAGLGPVAVVVAVTQPYSLEYTQTNNQIILLVVCDDLF